MTGNQTPPDALLFDLDGTLIDSERENVESVVLAVRRYGAELNEEERAFIVGHSWNEIYPLITRNHPLPVDLPGLIAAAVEERRVLFDRRGYRPLPGVDEAVRRLARRSKLAIVTGASRIEAMDCLHGLGLAELFPLVVAAEDYAEGKPSPEPYGRAIARLGVSPARSIAIEDATPGILSARAAGARVIGIRAGNFAGYDLSPADVVVDTMEEVTDALCARLVSEAPAR